MSAAQARLDNAILAVSVRLLSLVFCRLLC